MAEVTSINEVTLETVLNHLPGNEAQKYIFSRLDFDSLLSARCVNKQWQEIVDPLLEFHVALSDSTKCNVEKFGSDRHITSLSTSSFVGKYPENGLADLDVKGLRVSVKMLDDPDIILRPGKGKRERRKNVGISEYNCRRIFLDLNFIQKLHIASPAVRAFKNYSTLSKLRLPNLRSLIISIFDEGLPQLVPFMLNYFPSLKKVNIANVSSSRHDRTSVYSWIFGFVARHYLLLDDVTVIFPEGIIDDARSRSVFTVHENGGGIIAEHFRTTTIFQPMNDHKMPHGMYELAKSKLEKLTLKNLIWDISMMEGTIGRYDMATTLLISQKQLSKLHLDNFRMKDIGLWNKLGTLLETCAGTLSSLSMGGCFCNSLLFGNPTVFNCSWIRNCTKLKLLEISICGLHMESIEDIPLTVTTLNMGHMMKQEQLEALALRMVNLESWTLPQKGSIVTMFVPRISVYLFEMVLHLPKLHSVTVYESCSDETGIMEFINHEEGIHPCINVHLCGGEDLTFHVDRKKFSRRHEELQQFIERNRPDPFVPGEEEDDDVIEIYVREMLMNFGNH